MTNSTNIQKRQNEPPLLKIQFASRELYNSAEKINYIVWIACIISAISAFMPNSFPKQITIALPFVADMITFLLMFIVNKNIDLAARMRSYFDAYVFNIGLNYFSQSEIENIKEKSEEIYLKKKQFANQQLLHNGKDTPPGMRDWYVFSSNLEGLSAIFECQRQNTWWNKKISAIRYYIIFAVICALTIFFAIFCRNNVLEILLCSAGIIIKTIERGIATWNYFMTSHSIDVSQEFVENDLTEKNIIKLQEAINRRRAIPVMEINLYHKLKAKHFSMAYEKRTHKSSNNNLSS